jgi:hypothetical protein
MVLFFCLAAIVLLGGCQLAGSEKETGQAQEFTIVPSDEVPEELDTIIQENLQGEIRLTFEDQGILYLVRGYGEQKSGGYSIAVDNVGLSEDGTTLYVDTSLIGPTDDQKIGNETSYPYIVIRMKDTEAEVEFR